MSWNKIGLLAGNPSIGRVRVEDGYGIVAAFDQPDDDDLTRRLRGRRAALLRVTATTMDPCWEGPGTIEVIDSHGDIWAAVIATLKAGGSGSDYTMLRSLDAGKTWQERGSISALSVRSTLVVSEDELWVLGPRTLARSTDGGKTWQPVVADGDRSIHETLRRDAHTGAVALLGKNGISLSDDAATWNTIMGGVWATDLAGERVLGIWEDVAGVAERSASQPYGTLPAGRLPLRLTSSGDKMRVLSRSRDGRSGVEITVHRSEDDGHSWTDHPLKLSQHVDIAGEHWGLGLDAIGGVYVAAKGDEA